MTHLHVPDGVLPWWLIGLSLLLGGVAVLGVLRIGTGAWRVRFHSRIGVAAAALTVALSLPIGAAHLSLAPLAGMLLGPAGGFLAAFLANASVAAVGHGGVTAIGVNGLFLGLQAAAGALLFRLFRGPLGVRGGAGVAAGLVLVLASAGALAALRALPLAPDADGHHGHEGMDWGVWVVAAFALAVTIAEVHLTISVMHFLSRVRTDLVPGGLEPPAAAPGGPA